MKHYVGSYVDLDRGTNSIQKACEDLVAFIHEESGLMMLHRFNTTA